MTGVTHTKSMYHRTYEGHREDIHHMAAFAPRQVSSLLLSDVNEGQSRWHPARTEQLQM
jgi:hypothetical protein